MAVPLAMKLADFRPQEQACCAKQMWIRRHFDKMACKRTTIQMSPPTKSVSTNLANDNGGLLSMMMSESVTDPPPASPLIQQQTIDVSVGGMVTLADAAAMVKVEARARRWRQWRQ